MVLVSLKLNVRNNKAKDLFASFKVRCVESQTFKLLAMPTLNRRWHSFRLWSTVVLWCAKCCDQARKQSFSSDDSHRPEHAIDLFHAPTQGVSGKFLGRNHVHQQVDNPVAVAPPQHGERNQRTETLISHTLISNWKCHHDQNILDLFHNRMVKFKARHSLSYQDTILKKRFSPQSQSCVKATRWACGLSINQTFWMPEAKKHSIQV